MRDMKDSGIEWIGKIPANKNIVRNKYYVSYTKGKNPISLNSEGFGKPYIGASDLDTLNNTYENYTTDEYIPECTKDDILVLWDGARAGLLGTNKIGCISSTIVKLEVIPEVIYTHFFFWYLKGFEKFLSDMVTGTTIPHMNRRYIEDIQFIDFSLHQQQAIADYLDGECARIDGIVTTQRQIIERLKEYKKSVITEAVTRGLNPDVPMKDSGIEWIGKIPQHWEIKKIKYLFQLRDERNYLPLEQVNLISLYTDKGVLQHADIEETTGNKAQNADGYKLVYEGDIIVNIILCWMGAIGFSAYNGVTSPAYDIYKPLPKTNSKYYHYLFRTSLFSGECYKVGRGIMLMRWRTYSDQFKSIYVSVPPIEEQQEIADYLDGECARIDTIIEKRERMIELMTEYKKSLIYECVTGKKEIVDVME